MYMFSKHSIYKNKQLILHHYLVENNIDLCVLTETMVEGYTGRSSIVRMLITQQ